MPEPILDFNCNYVTDDPDYQEKYQELLEREDFFPDYEENGIDQSAAGDPYLDDGDDEMDPETEEVYNNLVWTQSMSESDKAKFQHISFIKQFGLW
ncbi:polyadenylate-binding protein-interacting protein 1-like [Neofelis nebulosa]|uniref:polyadenylate-binding protein-interacting protein 1-like n=1 Tax=Neofelis nebulosa TaxID=61452 RepID=UPI00272AB731|nr:polyadenylate-binding protein-interacting protein 1-like [Neofelis nebulosa]